MKEKAILRVVTKAFIPFILLFAFYVQFHGDYGPGGGFQAGVIFASGIIVFGLVYGLSAAKQVLPPRVVEIGVSTGLLLFGGVGVASLLMGGNYLDYRVFNAHDPMHGLHLGVLLVEAGVGITVACSMTAIFYWFAGREQS
jgi:multicomponent Na+:H+ antiporter subunit B